MKCLAKKENVRLYEDESGLFWIETPMDLSKTELSWEGEQALQKTGKIRQLDFGFYTIKDSFVDQEAFDEVKRLLEPVLICLWIEGRLM